MIGDLAGSIYEYPQTKKVSTVDSDVVIPDGAFFSDDTILTTAICDAILSDAPYESKLREYIQKYSLYRPNVAEYFKTPFSPSLMAWAEDDLVGYSGGNGAMMRVSPVGYLFDSEEDVLLNAELATIPSHRSKEAITCAQIVALMIFYFRQGLSKDEVFNKLNLTANYTCLKSFNTSCYDTLPVVLYAIYYGEDFEDSIKLARSFGGDTDTNCAITGSIAEAIYGIDTIVKKEALAKIPSELAHILLDAEIKVKDIKEKTL